MILFLRSQTFLRTLTLILGVSLLIAGLARFGLPVLFMPQFVVPAPLLLSVLYILVVAPSLRSTFSLYESMSNRAIGAARVGVHLFLFASAVATLFLGLMVAGHQELLAPAIRNLVGFWGLGLLSAACFGHEWLWIIPFCYAAAAAMVGIDSYNRPLAWAWPLGSSVNDASILLAVLCLVAGVGSVLLRFGAGRALAQRDCHRRRDQ
jgi:hypothetical protein